VLLAALAAAFVIGCRSTPEAKLVGVWVDPADSQHYLEFRRDGVARGVQYANRGPWRRDIDYRYEIVDNKTHVVLSSARLPQPETLGFSISSEGLTLVLRSGTSVLPGKEGSVLLKPVASLPPPLSSAEAKVWERLTAHPWESVSNPGARYRQYSTNGEFLLWDAVTSRARWLTSFDGRFRLTGSQYVRVWWPPSVAEESAEPVRIQRLDDDYLTLQSAEGEKEYFRRVESVPDRPARRSD
jgi:hypothetical protein